MSFFETELNNILKITDPIQKYERFFSLIYIYIDGQHSDIVIKILNEFIQEAQTKTDFGYEAIYY
jgi:hypothetical protein